MLRKAMLMVLTVLSGADIGLLMTASQHPAQPANGSEISQVVTVTNNLSGTATGIETKPLTSDNTAAPQISWVEIKSAAPFLNPLTADGAIELVVKQQVVLLVDGVIDEVAVKVGDVVKAGDLLVRVDESDLARAVERAKLDLATAQAELDKLQEASSPGEIAAAQANLDAAQANLEQSQRGASQAELDAAQSRLLAAQARYRELSGPPSGAEIDEVRAELEKAEIAVQTARRAYDAIGGSKRADIGTTPESQQLYQATVELERVQAKFNRINTGSSQSTLQDALSNIEKAKADIADLQAKPKPSDIADAQAKVKEAEERLSKLQLGASASELEGAKVKVEKASLDLSEAEARLQKSKVSAPIQGTVLEIGVTPGERGSMGKVVATLADTSQLQLTVKVAEVDIARVAPSQPVSITLDALRGRSFNGVVVSIAPTNQENRDVVNYPVTIRLSDSNLDGVRPGMSAQVKLSDAADHENRWLVPQNAIVTQADGTQVVLVQRGETIQSVVVRSGESYGEWIVVESAALRGGDVVQGSVTSGADSQP